MPCRTEDVCGDPLCSCSPSSEYQRKKRAEHSKLAYLCGKMGIKPGSCNKEEMTVKLCEVVGKLVRSGNAVDKEVIAWFKEHSILDRTRTTNELNQAMTRTANARRELRRAEESESEARREKMLNLDTIKALRNY